MILDKASGRPVTAMVSFVAQPFGTPPNTLAGFALNQFNNLDFFDISLVDGFNVPMAFKPNSSGCTRGISCLGDINDMNLSHFAANLFCFDEFGG
ncbi:hypothetical protein R6Q59_004316 [Mikania micrantha]